MIAHPCPPLPRARLVVVLLFLCATSLIPLACGRDNRYEEIHALAPGVPEECLRHLLYSDDETFARYAREMGAGFLYEVNLRLGEIIDTSTEEDFVRTRALALPLMFRVTRFIQSERGDDDPFPTGYPTLVDTIAPAEAVRRRELAEERQRIIKDDEMPADDKVERLLAFAKDYKAQGMPGEAGWCRWRIAEIIGGQGDSEGELRMLLRAREDYRGTDRYRNICQLLGMIGSMYEETGAIDSMFAAYEEARELADRLRLPNHAARIRLFEAHYYRRAGRLSRAHDLYNEAQEVCREYGGGHYELRYVFEAMRFYADLGGWEIVERLLHRARALLRGTGVDFLQHQELHRSRVARIEGRYLMATGDVEGADKVFKAELEEARGLPWRWEFALYLLYWAQGLVDNGEPARALPLIDEGIALIKTLDPTDYSSRFLLLQARAYFDLSDATAAREAIAAFDAFARSRLVALRSEWVTRDVLQTRLALAEDDRGAALDALVTGLNRLRTQLVEMDASAHAYLWIRECDELRQLLHELAPDDPLVGYGIELYWRDGFVWMGDHERGGDGGSAAVELTASGLWNEMRARAQAALGELTLDDVHALYAVRGGALVRWTATTAGVRRDDVGLAPEAVAELAGDAWRLMATAPDGANAPAPTALVDVLGRLGHALLPQEVVSGHARTLLVTVDGALSRLPFETLNVAPDREYEPLIDRCNVAYVRHATRLPALAADGPGVILVNAGVAPSLRRRHPFQQPLAEVEREGTLLAARYPDARLLIGKGATKRELTAAWSHAPFLYIATHMLRDPEAPYYQLIPLAEGRRGEPDAASLDIADIRRGDFRAARIVVLSGCSSGAPYVGAHGSAASLGDAFVDAGAGVVVQTFWDVRDEDAANLMADFVARSGVTATSGVGPLNDARRALVHTSSGAVRHPFYWAAYAINLNGL